MHSRSHWDLIQDIALQQRKQYSPEINVIINTIYYYSLIQEYFNIVSDWRIIFDHHYNLI